uniref:Uncharacterized protein n=1 Tax=Candidatus Kentrum eta TaxID=2126337 RepID=A0A450UVM1_9GAMM|nr:MAG: hypothetical protein BECKH772A_GA0070896_1010610 [Candidatus Kentron sp. H]VFJ97986.1 MAG: hypothetical protein BECKH772B_GA0070898_101239 [Candidatus Kentron sp. H]VFK03124.1 MAG: hypothetical protein BECKH772C_GA0070978_101149 [Candidatus Kentron sp. H]
MRLHTAKPLVHSLHYYLISDYPSKYLSVSTTFYSIILEEEETVKIIPIVPDFVYEGLKQ